MSADPTRHDVDVVTHVLLALGVVAADGYVLLFLVPDLFNRHRSELDLALVAVVVGALAFSYLAGRYLWRSLHSITDGEDT
jgi:hypothetical protein